MSEQLDLGEKKPSFASCKKYVDDYIKSNIKFKDFDVEFLRSGANHPISKGIITGIRKDNRFVMLNEDGVQDQISNYSLDDWIIPNKLNEPIFEQGKLIEENIDALKNQLRELRSKLIRVTLKDVIHQYTSK